MAQQLEALLDVVEPTSAEQFLRIVQAIGCGNHKVEDSTLITGELGRDEAHGPLLKMKMPDGTVAFIELKGMPQ